MRAWTDQPVRRPPPAGHEWTGLSPQASFRRLKTVQLKNDEVASFTPARNLRPVYGAIGLSPIHLWSGGDRVRCRSPEGGNDRLALQTTSAI